MAGRNALPSVWSVAYDLTRSPTPSGICQGPVRDGGLAIAHRRLLAQDGPPSRYAASRYAASPSRGASWRSFRGRCSACDQSGSERPPSNCSPTNVHMLTPDSSFLARSRLISSFTTFCARRPYQARHARAYIDAASDSVTCILRLSIQRDGDITRRRNGY
jgi:hypothetical protein